MTDKARLIIPPWGTVYAEKLVSMTLPALLASGNLPSLATMFDVEVTESKLVDYIRQARSFQRLTTICQVKFASLDDLMPCGPGEYGVVLTVTLFRGFVDWGAKVTETFLLFLNADFIIADGSYRRPAQLMREGKGGHLGLAYKENTNSKTNSTSLALISTLAPWRLKVYDPVVPGLRCRSSTGAGRRELARGGRRCRCACHHDPVAGLPRAQASRARAGHDRAHGSRADAPRA